MAEYRTITVKADLANDILTTAALVTELPSANVGISNEKIPVTATISDSQIVAAVSFVNTTIDATGEITTRVIGGDVPMYTGEYEVTPSQETHILYTADKALANNIIINPIPSNYGLVTWDGATLTVS